MRAFPSRSVKNSTQKREDGWGRPRSGPRGCSTEFGVYALAWERVWWSCESGLWRKKVPFGADSTSAIRRRNDIPRFRVAECGGGIATLKAADQTDGAILVPVAGRDETRTEVFLRLALHALSTSTIGCGDNLPRRRITPAAEGLQPSKLQNRPMGQSLLPLHGGMKSAQRSSSGSASTHFPPPQSAVAMIWPWSGHSPRWRDCTPRSYTPFPTDSPCCRCRAE